MFIDNQHANYLITGYQSMKAFNSAKRLITDANRINKGKMWINPKLKKIPDPRTYDIDPKGGYFFYVDNETIDGIEFPYVPDSKG